MKKTALESLEVTLCNMDLNYWNDKRFAWIYGIVFGLTDEMREEMCKLHGWDKRDFARLEQYHNEYVNIRNSRK